MSNAPDPAKSAATTPSDDDTSVAAADDAAAVDEAASVEWPESAGEPADEMESDSGGESEPTDGWVPVDEREPVDESGSAAADTSPSTRRSSTGAAKRAGDEAAGEGRRWRPWQPVGAVFRRGWASPLAGRITVGVLVLLLAGALAVGGYAGWGAVQHHRDDAARAAAVSAATKTVTNFMSISSKTVDHDLKRVLSGATGNFKKQFKNGMGQTKTAVVENKVTSKAHVLRAGVLTSKRKSATVLVAMDATVKNTNAPKGRLAHYRVRVTMAEQDGRWLVSGLKFV